MSLPSMAEVVCMATVESEWKMHCPIILVSVKDPFFYIYKYIYFVYIYLFIFPFSICIDVYMSLISTKHFAKYIQNTFTHCWKCRGARDVTRALLGTGPGQHRQLRGSRSRSSGRGRSAQTAAALWMHGRVWALGEGRVLLDLPRRSRTWCQSRLPAAPGLAQERQVQRTAALPEASLCSAC